MQPNKQGESPRKKRKHKTKGESPNMWHRSRDLPKVTPADPRSDLQIVFSWHHPSYSHIGWTRSFVELRHSDVQVLKSAMLCAKRWPVTFDDLFKPSGSLGGGTFYSHPKNGEAGSNRRWRSADFSPALLAGKQHPSALDRRCKLRTMEPAASSSSRRNRFHLFHLFHHFNYTDGFSCDVTQEVVRGGGGLLKWLPIPWLSSVPPSGCFFVEIFLLVS